MNERILQADRRQSFRVFRWQQEQQEPPRDEQGRFAAQEEPPPPGSADGGAHGPEPVPEPPTMNDFFAGALMQKQSEQAGWVRLAQKTREP